MRSFASDNNSGAHPRIIEAIVRANCDHEVAYGDDPYTGRAIAKFREHFGPDAEVFFTFNGTGANVLGLKALTRSYHSILCAEGAHIAVDECGAPEKFLGCKLIPVPTQQGKLTVDAVAARCQGVGDPHHSQPRVISISQVTEQGTVYTPEEISTLARFAHSRGMYLHMDGARLANAAASLGLPLAAITRDAGVDVLSFEARRTDFLGEAVVFLRSELAEGFPYIRKQGMQLSSKMRFIAAQFEALLTDDLWLKNAVHANRMAQRLAEGVRGIPGVRLAREVRANGVFAVLPRDAIHALREKHFFYVWNEAAGEVRWMTSFDTTEEDVTLLIESLRALVRSPSA